jgi:hypothetical protein
MEDPNERLDGPEDRTVEGWLSFLYNMDPNVAKGNARISGISLERLQALAGHLGLSRSQGKARLVDSIRESIERKRRLNETEAVENGGSFRKDKNTVPRMVNILCAQSDLLTQADRLATRNDLQNREVNGSKPIYIESAIKFNDMYFNSGGLPTGHEEYDNRNLDPEAVNISGPITAEKMYKLFKELKVEYSKAYIRWSASGHHDGSDFYAFCQGNVECLYFFEVLRAIGSPELIAYCGESCEIPGGLETYGTPVPGPTSHVANSSSASSSVSSSSSTTTRQNHVVVALNSVVKSLNSSVESAKGDPQKQAMAAKLDSETRVILSNYLETIEDKIAKFEDSPNYDSSNTPPKKLKRLRAEYEKCTESFSAKFH